VFPLQLPQKIIMSKKRKNSNYKNYNQANRKREMPEVEIRVGQENLYKLATPMFDKSMKNVVSIGYFADDGKIKKEEICVKDVLFDFKETSGSNIKLVFENKIILCCELERKIETILSTVENPIFFVETYNGNTYVNCFLVFPDTVYWVADNVITVEFSNSTVAVPRAGARIR